MAGEWHDDHGDSDEEEEADDWHHDGDYELRVEPEARTAQARERQQ